MCFHGACAAGAFHTARASGQLCIKFAFGKWKAQVAKEMSGPRSLRRGQEWSDVAQMHPFGSVGAGLPQTQQQLQGRLQPSVVHQLPWQLPGALHPAPSSTWVSKPQPFAVIVHLAGR